MSPATPAPTPSATGCGCGSARPTPWAPSTTPPTSPTWRGRGSRPPGARAGPTTGSGPPRRRRRLGSGGLAGRRPAGRCLLGRRAPPPGPARGGAPPGRGRRLRQRLDRNGERRRDQGEADGVEDVGHLVGHRVVPVAG